MPIYEYECRVCGYRLEKLQKISDAPLIDCPECGAAGLRKLVSAAAFRLKGGGWYETDFKDEKSRRNVAKEDDKTSAKSDGDKDAAAGESGAKTKQDAGKEAKSESASATSPAG